MSDVSLAVSPGSSHDIDVTLAGQTRLHLRALQRALCHHGRPTNQQRNLLRLAATAQARVSRALYDPTTSGHNIAHLERVARAAVKEAYAAFPKPPVPLEPTLEELLGHE
jgi:hypothetical protein